MVKMYENIYVLHPDMLNDSVQETVSKLKFWYCSIKVPKLTITQVTFLIS